MSFRLRPEGLLRLFRFHRFKLAFHRWIIDPLIEFILSQVPVGLRFPLARRLLYLISDSAKVVQSIASNDRTKMILLVSLHRHTREIRVANAAVSAGWTPVLLYTGTLKYRPEDHFRYHARLRSRFEVVLFTWLFPNNPVHVFGWLPQEAFIFSVTKAGPVIIDYYDICSTMLTMP